MRHASHDRLDRVLCGRMEGVGLGAAGNAEAARLAERLAREPVAAVCASPLQRARETAEPIAARFDLGIAIEPDLQEIDFGAWTGKPFAELHGDPTWEAWNARRSLAQPPGGERMAEAQVRAVDALERIAAAHPDQAVAAVSHSDVIKAVLCHYLGLDLDHMHRFETDPASISTLVVGDWGAKVLRINEGVGP